MSNPILQRYPSIIEAYLFESYARGEATENSDLDFMIVLNDYSIESLKDELRVEEDLREIFNKKVDTLNVEDAMRIMKKSIERDAKKIYEQTNQDKI